VQKSLVAFDTDHIKNYVFGTDKLKEISGASSLLDRLNRQVMVKIARSDKYKIEKECIIYTNGGSGLFVVDSEKVEDFGKEVQKAYRELTGGGASITYAVQPLPPEALQGNIEDLLGHDLSEDHTLELVRYKLREEKEAPTGVQAFPSHPLMRPCDACGMLYAEEEDHEVGDTDTFYCGSCFKKREEEKKFEGLTSKKDDDEKQTLWERIISYLNDEDYDFVGFDKVSRPQDFNEFRQFAASKEYVGLIYADANNMGTTIDGLKTLQALSDFAKKVDDAIFVAMSRAIKAHLPIVNIERQKGRRGDKRLVPSFPFDVLLVGGDDIVMVTDAAKAMDVALTIAKEFYEETHNRHSLCVGVVLAPIKYPFGLLLDMAESALKFAKKSAADDKRKAGNLDQFDDTRINFQVVTGGSHPNFNETYKEIYHKVDKDKKLEFHASLRPYKPADLQTLLAAIHGGHEQRLGRTKLHQLREAVLEENLTTSVQKGLATLRNWRDGQRAYVVRQVYEFGKYHQMLRSNPHDPISGFPRVTFPWFADDKNKGRDVYRTSLLDFIELYDFVTRGENNGDKA
jgi:hypothetical protein